MPFLGLLTGIPLWAWALAAVTGWGAFGHWTASTLREQLTEERAVVRAEAARATALNEAETKRMKIEAEGNANALKAQLEVVRLRAAADGGTVARLQLALSAIRRGSAVPGTATSATPGEAIERTADVAGLCIKRFREVVDLARAGFERARACERHADAIVKPLP